MNELLPNFFIVGSAKSGTTSLFHYLRQHPQIYLPPIKEVYYFASDIDYTRFRSDYSASLNRNIDKWLDSGMKDELFQAFIHDWSKYVKLFRLATEKKAIGEMSNAYLYSSTAAKNISRKIPHAKIIMILRNPVERAFSHYLMDLRIGYESGSFKEALERDMQKQEKGWGISNLYVELGMYYAQVRRFQEIFPPEQIKIFLYDNYRLDSLTVLSEICDFLEVDTHFNFDISRTHNKSVLPKSGLIAFLNKQKRIKNWLKEKLSAPMKGRLKQKLFTDKNLPELSGNDRALLISIFKEDIQNLSSLIDRDLSAWTTLK